MKIKNILLGRTLKNHELQHEKLSRLWGLPIMASDAVSSVAYAIEEMLIILVPVIGLLSFHFVPRLIIPILILLVLLVLSYSQIIDHYPNGGGAYSVAKENIGKNASLVAAASLIMDYILTVAVSISASTAALVSAFPFLIDHKVTVSILCVLIVTLINLRGLKESSKIFGLPTYIFIISMLIMIIVGFYKLFTGNLNPVVYSEVTSNIKTIEGVSIFLLLRAFSSGCAAMSGVEAVSNAIPSFKDPAARNAKHILYMLGGIIIVLLGGTSYLTLKLHVLPIEHITVLSQIAEAVFGKTFMYYVLQVFTSLILILASNTAYNDLPRLLYLLAHDGYVPRQFSSRGTKLSFSNGIIFLCIASGFLIFIFNSDVNSLIPLYSVGVFISFTVSQFGMLLKWVREKEKNWQYKMWINAIGCLATFVVAIIVFTTKFLLGAWMLGIAFPILMFTMSIIRKHYDYIERQISMDNCCPLYSKDETSSTQCIILVNSINKPLLKAINYANSISTNITAVHVCRHPEHAIELREHWNNLHVPIPLEIIETPYRDIIKPMDEYLWDREAELKHGENITVIIIKFITDHWYDSILHNQSTYFITQNLSKHKNISTAVLPFHYNLDKKYLLENEIV